MKIRHTKRRSFLEEVVVIRNTNWFLLLLALSISSNTMAFQHNRPKVVIQTSFGDIAVELFPDEAPITVNNFLQYVNSGFYDNLIFHRVWKNFMIQGGGFYVEVYPYPLQRQPGDPIINESSNGLSNLRGTIAMARTSEPNSATSEFFINHVDNLFLDRKNAADGFGYCVFGRVIKSMDVVDAIAQTPIGYLNVNFTHYPYPTLVYINRAIVAPPGYWLAADLDNSGIADSKDFTILASNWSAAGSELPGDLNKDNTVDSTDLLLFANGWLQTTNWYWVLQADLNGDNIVSLEDFACLASDWSKTADGLNGDLDGSRTVDLKDLEIFIEAWLKTIN